MNLHSYSRLSLKHSADSTTADQPSPSQQQLDFDTLISRYLAGESVQTLAAEAGKHRATIYRWMLAGLGDDDYHDAVTQCLVTRIADADQRLESAQDGCDIARAREMAKFARMDFERRRPALYGQKQEVTHELGQSFTHALLEISRRRSEKVIATESVDQSGDNSAPEPDGAQTAK